MAWGAALCTSEWVIYTLKETHTRKTLYFSSLTRSYLKKNTVSCKVDYVKNWRCGVFIHFADTCNIFSVPMLVDKVISHVIKYNNIIPVPGKDPLLQIPKKACLLNLNPSFAKQKPIHRSLVTPTLNKIAKECGIDEKVYGYSYRRGFCTWACDRGCSSLLLKIFGRWSSDAYKHYRDYTIKNLRQLSLCSGWVLHFYKAILGQMYEASEDPKMSFPWTK